MLIDPRLATELTMLDISILFSRGSSLSAAAASAPAPAPAPADRFRNLCFGFLYFF